MSHEFDTPHWIVPAKFEEYIMMRQSFTGFLFQIVSLGFPGSLNPVIVFTVADGHRVMYVVANEPGLGLQGCSFGVSLGDTIWGRNVVSGKYFLPFCFSAATSSCAFFSFWSSSFFCKRSEISSTLAFFLCPISF